MANISPEKSLSMKAVCPRRNCVGVATGFWQRPFHATLSTSFSSPVFGLKLRMSKLWKV